MRNSVLFSMNVSLSGLMLLAGCDAPPEEVAVTVARPVKSIVIETPEGSGVRNFPGRIESANRAELAFRVGGTVAQLSVEEGTQVEQGQLLARLDQTDFEIALKDRQAVWDRSTRDYERSKELVEQGAISRRDFDRVEANFKSADAALEQARQNLDYTNLRAPFTGQVGVRHIDRFEEVTPGEIIYSLIDPQSLEVRIDVPENIILSLSSDRDPSDRGTDIDVWASFDVASDRLFPLQFKEVSTRADPQTQTFQVTFSLTQPEGVIVLPGMTASVTVDLSRVLSEEAVYYVPLTAVVGANDMTPSVWTVDETNMTVHEKPIKVGRMVGSSIEVLEGLEPGLRVVVAGAAYLAEGMSVSLLAQAEQAEPRT